MQTGSGHAPTINPALSGFRLVRERPRAIALWALLSLAFNLLEGLFVAGTTGPAVMRILALAEQANPDPNVAQALLSRIAPTYVVLVASSLAINAVFLAAANRAMFRPADDRMGYLGIGRDALLQFGLLLALSVIGFTVLLVLLMVSAALSAVMPPAAAGFLGGVIALLGLAYVWVRLSLASPSTFASGRIDVFASWALSRGRFWALARVYLVTLALAAVVYLLGFAVIGAGMSAALGGVSKFVVLAQLDVSSPAMFLTPAHLVVTVLQSGLSALILPVILCPAVEIYRTLATCDPAPARPTSGDGTPWG